MFKGKNVGLDYNCRLLKVYSNKNIFSLSKNFINTYWNFIFHILFKCVVNCL